MSSSPDHLATRRRSDDAGASVSRRWLLERYWIFAAAVFIAAAPLYVFFGSRADALGGGAYVVLTGACWLMARRSPIAGARLHLLTLFPYWAWYVGLEGGVPQRLHAGVAEYAILLVFPLLTLVTVEGTRGAAAGFVLGALGVLWRFDDMPTRAEGIFLLTVAVLVGLVFRRLARELDRANERMRRMAFRDELTGLANRRELEARMRAWLSDDSTGALLFVNLDRFRTVNDALGHGVGDDVICALADRLREEVNAPHVVARTGGDEFAVLLRGTGAEALSIAEAIVERVNEPCEVAGRVLHVGCSVGVALWPDHGHDLEQLMKSADVAMARAKTDGVAVAVHRPNDDETTLFSRGLEVDLYRALDDDELALEYQPIKDLAGDEFVGAEALVRWRHPERGTLPPARFIDLAEETGHIIAIDQWVLRHALAQLRVWHEHGFTGWMAVNVSARSLADENFVAELTAALSAERVRPQRLMIEITESAAMMDPEVSLARLAALVELGVGVAIDDFGMGYSSLAYLRRFPASHIKLDRAFTNGIGQHRRDEELIELVLQLAERFELVVVAEGIEDAAQAKWLAARGCRLAQGYALARPMSAGEFLTTTLGISSEMEVARPSQRGKDRHKNVRARRSLHPRRTG